MAKKILVLLAFVSSCGPLKMDMAKAERDPLDRFDAITISLTIYSCEELHDFLMDSFLFDELDNSTADGLYEDLGC